MRAGLILAASASASALASAAGAQTYSLPNPPFPSDGSGALSAAQAAAAYQPRQGVTDASNAATGQIGEVQTVQVTPASAVALTSAVPVNIASVALSAGDWQCSSVADFALGAATLSAVMGGLSTSSATLGPQDTYFSSAMALSLTTSQISQPTPRMRLSAAGPMVVYLVGQATFAVGTVKAYGTVFCRRMR